MDNKAIAAGIAFVGLASLAAFAAFTLMSRTSGETSRAVTDKRAEAAIDFPAQRSRRPALPAARAQAARVDATQTRQQSSLGFIKKDGDFAGGGAGPAGASESAAEAAARGDVSGMMRGMREDPGDVPDTGGKPKADRTRATMQSVVDTVKRMEPKWYEQFLANKYLKRIADDYDQSNDFKGFLKALGKSRSFERMLKAKSRTQGMKKLTRYLLKSDATSKGVRRILISEAANPDVQHLLGRYGTAAGLPADIVKGAQAGMKLIGGKKTAPRQATSKGRRLRLEQRGFDKGFGKDGGGRQGAGQAPGGFDPSQLPPGVDPQELLKQYQGK